MNLPYLIKHFAEWGIEEVVICSSVNKIGYLMSPDIKTYKETLKSLDRNKYQIMAMSILASGAIPPNEAVQYVTQQKVDSIVFGASSEKNIRETKRLIDDYFTYQ